MRGMAPVERFLRLDDRFPENLYSRIAYKYVFVIGVRRTMLQVLIDVEMSRRQAVRR